MLHLASAQMDDVQQTEGTYPADEPIVERALGVIAVKAPIALKDGFVLRARRSAQTVQEGITVTDPAEGIFAERVRG